MCTHEHCPIREGRCITEKPGWEWAEKFGLPEANPTQRRFLIEQSARWNEVVVKDGEPEPEPHPVPAEAIGVRLEKGLAEGGEEHFDCGCNGKGRTAVEWAKGLSEEDRKTHGISPRTPLSKLKEAFRNVATK